MDGSFLVGARRVTTDERFQAFDPSSDQAIEPGFSSASPEHVATACRLADEAFDSFRETEPAARARFLEAIADNIEAVGDELVTRAMAESGLPQPRLAGERARTTGQLRLFAEVLRQGRWARVTVDEALPDRQPLPRPDLRQRRVALGPVAVFGASNFPLAYSVAGGDTAAALAAGCPVVVKGHPAHPGTSAMVGEAIAAAVASSGFHEGVFSLLQGPSNALGAGLVADPHIKAVGFTGSRTGGLALAAIAAARPEPIPVFAEMSSINPVILLPHALSARAEALGAAFVASLTMSAGQFCTNPGLILALAGPDLDRFVAAAADALAAAEPQVMLTAGIAKSYGAGTAALLANPAVRAIGRGRAGTGCNRGEAALFMTEAESFLADPALSHEVFGASSLIVRARDLDEIARVVRAMEGQLTATLQMDAGDVEDAGKLLPLLERKAGRILANGWPTGVEVAPAMVHGGPFPATTDSRFTAVGAASIDRFLRPVCYQNLPDALLPAALRHGNPLGLPRLVNGDDERR